jgi:hypothetical protein
MHTKGLVGWGVEPTGNALILILVYIRFLFSLSSADGGRSTACRPCECYCGERGGWCIDAWHGITRHGQILHKIYVCACSVSCAPAAMNTDPQEVMEASTSTWQHKPENFRTFRLFKSHIQHDELKQMQQQRTRDKVEHQRDVQRLGKQMSLVKQECGKLQVCPCLAMSPQCGLVG